MYVYNCNKLKSLPSRHGQNVSTSKHIVKLKRYLDIPGGDAIIMEMEVVLPNLTHNIG